MTSTTTSSSFALVPSLEAAWHDVDSSFERFCLTAGFGRNGSGVVQPVPGNAPSGDINAAAG